MKKEIIGLTVKVIESRNKSNIGLTGKIIDETKNTISLQVKNTVKKIIKKDVEIKINGEKIKGRKMAVRPEERLKI